MFWNRRCRPFKMWFGLLILIRSLNDDVIKWKHFPCHWPLSGEFTGHQFSNSFIKDRYLGAFSVKLPSGECHKTSLIISEHCFQKYHGVIMQQVITWTNVDTIKSILIKKDFLRWLLIGQWCAANQSYICFGKLLSTKINLIVEISY